MFIISVYFQRRVVLHPEKRKKGNVLMGTYRERNGPCIFRRREKIRDSEGCSRSFQNPIFYTKRPSEYHNFRFM